MEKLISKDIFLFLVGIFSSTLYAQEIDRTKAPIDTNPPKINFGKPELIELKNGLRILVVENHKLPILSLSLSLDYPSVALGDKAGLSSVFSSMLKAGTKKYNKEHLDEKLEALAADLHASTHGAFMSVLSKNIEPSMELFSQVVLHPTFDNLAEFNKFIKQRITSLEVSEKDPNAIASRVRDVIYYGKDHPFGEQAREKTLRNINLQDLKNYHSKYFTPDVAYLAFVGDITKKKAIKLAKKYFSKWKGTSPSFEKYITQKPSTQKEIYMVDLPSATQSFIYVGGLSNFKISNKDYLSASLANKVLGEGMSGKLTQNLREKNGFAYYAYSALIPNKHYEGSFYALSQVRTEVTAKALVEFIKEIEGISTKLEEENELTNHKKQMIGNFALSLESPQTIADLAISTLKNKLPEDFYANYLQTIQKISAQEVLEAAKKYIPSERAKILIVGNQKAILPEIQKLGYKITFLDKWGNEIPYIKN